MFSKITSENKHFPFRHNFKEFHEFIIAACKKFHYVACPMDPEDIFFTTDYFNANDNRRDTIIRFDFKHARAVSCFTYGPGLKPYGC